MPMKRLYAALLCLFLTAGTLNAQSPENRSVLNSTTCPATSAAATGCVTLGVAGLSGVAVQVTGTYVGTLTFEVSLDGVTYSTLSLTPPNSTTSVTSPAGNATGIWGGAVGGASVVRVRMSAYTSGTATVTVKAAPMSGRGSGIGGGGGSIGGSLASGQVAVGSGVNTISGSSFITSNGSFFHVGSDSLDPFSGLPFDLATVFAEAFTGTTTYAVTNTDGTATLNNFTYDPTVNNNASIHAWKSSISIPNTNNKIVGNLYAGEYNSINNGTGAANGSWGLFIDVENTAATFADAQYGIQIFVQSFGGVVPTNYGIKIDDVVGATNNYAIKTGLGEIEFGDDLEAQNIQLSNGKALKTDTTTAHTALIQAYDVDGTAYKTFGTGTNGNTPSWDWSAPAGGSLTGNFTTLQVGSVSLLPSLSGTTGSIGGGLLAAGSCASGTVGVTSSTTAMTVTVSPNTYPGDGTDFFGYVSANGTVTVKVCALVAVTPTAGTYNVRVVQ